MKTAPMLPWKVRSRTFSLGPEPLLMGILNVTPDSFSDGGRFIEEGNAIARGLRLLDEGADIVDVGGESTRPGAADVPEDEELARVIPVIRGLRERRPDAVLSVDTMKAGVAREAARAGVDILNDVSALAQDAAMAGVAAEYGLGVVLMHRQGTPRTMQNDPRYADVVVDVTRALGSRVDAAVRAGIDRQALSVDPGIGFGKTLEHNLDLLANLHSLGGLGLPVTVGLSRKSFLGKLTRGTVEERLAGSLAAMLFCAQNGAHVMRVHDVRESRDALRVTAALRGVAQRPSGGPLTR